MSARNRSSLPIREMVVFAMLGTVMFCSKIIMEALPNIHLLGMLTMTYTLAFRKKALIPIYIYVMLNGLYAGFNMWWMPYLYVWTILWGITMLIPKQLPTKVKCVVFPLVCGIHGFAFGMLYAPAQAVMFGMNFEQMIAWIIAGLPFDVIHGIGNFIAGLLILPLSELLECIVRRINNY
jgi:hypothetical protein